MMKLVLLLLLVAIASDFLGKGNTRQDADTINFPLRDFPEKYVAKRVFHERISEAGKKRKQESTRGDHSIDDLASQFNSLRISGAQGKRKRPTNWQEERDSPPRKRMKTSHPESFDARSSNPKGRQDEHSGLIPRDFDARKKWKDCCSIENIHDQGNCSSCWAVAATSVMDDRTCIHDKTWVSFRYSARNLATCCKDCGDIEIGGYLNESFKYWRDEGIVSGGYGDFGCQPYRIEKMKLINRKLECEKCDKSYTLGDYESDKHFASSITNVEANVTAIQREIMTYGPVAAGIRYNESDRKCSSNAIMTCTGTTKGHAVRIIGWEKNYWVVANSWGCDKKDLPILKIKQGTCNIEDNVWAGMP